MNKFKNIINERINILGNQIFPVYLNKNEWTNVKNVEEEKKETIMTKNENKIKIRSVNNNNIKLSSYQNY
jgi:hypothetical protein